MGQFILFYPKEMSSCHSGKAKSNCRLLPLGTSSISILFDIFPYCQSRAMKVTSLAFFSLNMCLFLIFLAWGVVRFSMHPGDLRALMKDPASSLFWGCFPMCGATLLNTALTVVHGNFAVGGKGFLYSLWILWLFDVVISCACCWGTILYMYVS